MIRSAHGSGGLQHITKKEFLLLWLPYPTSVEEQDLISKAMQDQDSRILKAETHLAKLRHVKTGLMQDLLTGSVPVPEAMVKELSKLMPPASEVGKSPQAVRRPM